MERIFAEGCEAMAEAAIRAGCRFFAGYPITPQTEFPEYMSRRMPEVGGTFIQAESELAAINMVYGAASTGTYAMTSSSSLGISLKTEGMSYLAASHIPAVIMSVQRGGPGIGNITASQSDYWQSVKAPGNGGHKCMVFTPATLQECVDVMPLAFQKSQRDRNPVIILIDGCIANIREAVTLPEMRPKPDIGANNWCLSGNKGRMPRALIPCSVPDPDAVANWFVCMQERWQENDVLVSEIDCEDADVIVTGYGTAGRICITAIKELSTSAFKLGLIRPITANPFPIESYRKLNPEKTKLIIDVEMAKPAQMVDDVRLSLDGKIPTETLEIPGGVIPTDEDVIEGIAAIIKRRFG